MHNYVFLIFLKLLQTKHISQRKHTLD